MTKLQLDSGIENLPLVGPSYTQKLDKLGITTIQLLLNHTPTRYLDYSNVTKILAARVDDTATIKGVVKSFINRRTKRGISMQLARIEDDSAAIDVVWFNQPYLISTFRKGVEASFAGKVGWFVREKTLISPDFELIGKGGLHTGRLVPIYPETKGVSSKWLRTRIATALQLIEVHEFLPSKVLEEFQLEKLESAYNKAHFPKNLTDAKKGIDRLAFNELLLLQLTTLQKKKNWESHRLDNSLKVSNKVLNEFASSLPFTLTNSQQKCVQEIARDLSRSTPMNRLLEGDVGSGKTVVAAAAASIVSANGKQCIFMAPTQILATQHYKTLKQLGKTFKLALITSDGVVGNPNSADIVVGTHSLIHKKFDLEKKDKVALVVVDEQQRFGVEQRAHLVKKTSKGTKAPHVLAMTATPIPRTVALTYYGDLDVSTLDELPKGRQKITTWVVPEAKRAGAYDWIDKQITNGAQAYVVCPLIEESEKLGIDEVKSVTQTHKELLKVFSKLKIGLLHGKISAKAKNKLLADFKLGKLDILVATPVVEVGVDVPKATVMVIESADRFGLSQLHQLRGRVGRGDKKSYCLLFAKSPSEIAKKRLAAIKSTQSGFEIAKLDLRLRGPGEIFGTAQSGFPELKIASWTDLKLINNTRKIAEQFTKNPNHYSNLHTWLQTQNSSNFASK